MKQVMSFGKSPIILFIMIAEFPEIHFFKETNSYSRLILPVFPFSISSVLFTQRNTTAACSPPPPPPPHQITPSAILPSTHFCSDMSGGGGGGNPMTNECQWKAATPEVRGFCNNLGDGDTVTKQHSLSVLPPACPPPPPPPAPGSWEPKGRRQGGFLKWQPGRFFSSRSLHRGLSWKWAPDASITRETAAIFRKASILNQPVPSANTHTHTHGHWSCDQNQIQLGVVGTNLTKPFPLSQLKERCFPALLLSQARPPHTGAGHLAGIPPTALRGERGTANLTLHGDHLRVPTPAPGGRPAAPDWGWGGRGGREGNGTTRRGDPPLLLLKLRPLVLRVPAPHGAT